MNHNLKVYSNKIINYYIKKLYLIKSEGENFLNQFSLKSFRVK